MMVDKKSHTDWLPRKSFCDAIRVFALLLIGVNCGCSVTSDDIGVMELGVGRKTSSISAYNFPRDRIGFFASIDRSGSMWATDYGSSIGPGGVAGDTF